MQRQKKAKYRNINGFKKERPKFSVALKKLKAEVKS